MTVTLPKVGELFASRYRILQQLGEGGYGVVYRARHDAMGRDVALKVLKPEVAKNDTDVERFRREVFHASSLRHPNTITLYDFGKEDDIFYIAMEYLEGMNLRDHLMKNGAIEHEAALDITMQILRSLREAHDAGIVHRDLKPENIFLVNVGQGERFVKVLDFGLSKYAEDAPSKKKEPTLTKDGVIFGTPQYMSPEQAYGQKVRPATDIYALGLLVFEMLSARSAFTGRSSMEILIKQVSHPLPSLPERYRATLLADFVERCSKKGIDERFKDASDAIEWMRQTRNDHSAIILHPTPEEIEQVDLEAIEHSTEQSTPGFRPGDDIEMRLAQLPMIGRERELDELVDWSRGAVLTGGVCWVTGETGIGKTRLIEEWSNHLEMDGLFILRGRYREDGDVLEGLREALSPFYEGEAFATIPAGVGIEQLARMKTILDNEHEEFDSDAAFVVIEHFIYALSRARPVALILEDLHWADSFTMRLVEHWQEDLASQSIPVLLICSTRVDDTGISTRIERVTSLTQRYGPVSFAHTVALQRLTENAQRDFLNFLVPMSDRARERVRELGRGNPRFLNELMRFLVEGELLTFDEAQEEWTFAEGVDTDDRLVPPNLRTLLMRRVKTIVNRHQLGAVLRAVLARGAILGHRFETRLLRRLLDAEGRTDLVSYLEDGLEVLARAGLLVPTVVDHRATLEFGYDVLRTTIMESPLVAGEDLQALHRLSAQVKREDVDEESVSPEFAASIAQHYRAAGDVREALEWWSLAAQRAERAQDFRAALTHWRDAESLLNPTTDPTGERLLDIRLSQGQLHRFLSEFGAAEFALSEALEEAERVGDLVGQARAGEELAYVFTLLGRFEEAQTTITSTRLRFAECNDVDGQVRIDLAEAELLRYRGRYSAAEDLFKTADEHDRSDRHGVRALIGLGMCAYAAGRLEEAAETLQRARRKAESLGDARLVARTDIELGLVAIFTRGVPTAERLLIRGLEAARTVGDSVVQAGGHLVLGMCLRRSTRVADAISHARRARVLAERANNHYLLAKVLLLEGELAWIQGQIHEAIDRAEEACELHKQIDDWHGLALCYIYMGLFETERGKPTLARQHLEAAHDLAGREALGLYEPHYLLFTGGAYELEGNLEEAVAYYGEALQRSEQNGNREIASLAACQLAKSHLIFGDFEAVKEDVPVARSQADLLGNNIALVFSITAEALLARLTGNVRQLRESIRRLRVLNDPRHGFDLRVPQRIGAIIRLANARQGERAAPMARALCDLLESIGASDWAEKFRDEFKLRHS